MDSRAQASLVFHGIVVIVLGLLAGIPFALVISGDLAGDVRGWRMAHLEGVLNGLVMLGVGAAGRHVVLSAAQTQACVLGLYAAGYGNVFASVIGASFGVRGLSPEGPASNFVVFALFSVAIVGVLVGLALAAHGALRARRGDTTPA